MVGTVILGQYHLVELLGRGGMSDVYLAEQASMDRHAVVKLLRAERDPGEEARRRFRQEARAVSRLSHPSIVTVFNFGQLADGTLFLAMEYVDGPSLGSYLAHNGPLDALHAADWAIQCAEGLGYAHGRKIVHRDLKPENVMVTNHTGREQIKILDFGIARLLDDLSLSLPGVTVGTPRYFSPEQCNGDPATPLSDQYALGLVLHELLTGQPVIMADTLIDCMHLQTSWTPPSPSDLSPDHTTRLLDPIVMRMIAKRSSERFGSMDEVAGELSAAVAEMEDSQLSRRGPATGKIPVAGPAGIILLESDQVLQGSDWDALYARGYRLLGVCADERDLGQASACEPDVALLSTSSESWRQSWASWSRYDITDRGVLTCIDGTIDPLRPVEAIRQIPHLLIGTHPVEPIVVVAALRWMQGMPHSLIETLVPAVPVQVLQVASSGLRGHYLASMVDDMRENGVRRRTLRAVQEVGEEMIMNALTHAPVGAAGWRSPIHRDLPGRATALRPGQEALLQWAIGERYVAVSIRDSFGSLAGHHIFGALSGPPGKRPDRTGKGGGLGLRIMLRHSSHLLFFVSPGRSCQVVALLEQEPGRRRSLCVLHGWGCGIQQIGDALWMHEAAAHGVTHIKLRGDINENCEMGAVFGRSGPVRVDLSDVASLNSRGIHLWTQASSKRDLALRLYFERCSPPVVSQFNMLPALAASGIILSIQAPYVCPSCGRESIEELSMDELRAHGLPARQCQACASPLEFDDMPEEYFAFMA